MRMDCERCGAPLKPEQPRYCCSGCWEAGVRDTAIRLSPADRHRWLVNAAVERGLAATTEAAGWFHRMACIIAEVRDDEARLMRELTDATLPVAEIIPDDDEEEGSG